VRALPATRVLICAAADPIPPREVPKATDEAPMRPQPQAVGEAAPPAAPAIDGKEPAAAADAKAPALARSDNTAGRPSPASSGAAKPAGAGAARPPLLTEAEAIWAADTLLQRYIPFPHPQLDAPWSGPDEQRARRVWFEPAALSRFGEPRRAATTAAADALWVARDFLLMYVLQYWGVFASRDALFEVALPVVFRYFESSNRFVRRRSHMAMATIVSTVGLSQEPSGQRLKQIVPRYVALAVHVSDVRCASRVLANEANARMRSQSIPARANADTVVQPLAAIVRALPRNDPWLLYLMRLLADRQLVLLAIGGTRQAAPAKPVKPRAPAAGRQAAGGPVKPAAAAGSSPAMQAAAAKPPGPSVEALIAKAPGWAVSDARRISRERCAVPTRAAVPGVLC
jgi:hypothetical protein